MPVVCKENHLLAGMHFQVGAAKANSQQFNSTPHLAQHTEFNGLGQDPPLEAKNNPWRSTIGGVSARSEHANQTMICHCCQQTCDTEGHFYFVRRVFRERQALQTCKECRHSAVWFSLDLSCAFVVWWFTTSGMFVRNVFLVLHLAFIYMNRTSQNIIVNMCCFVWLYIVKGLDFSHPGKEAQQITLYF